MRPYTRVVPAASVSLTTKTYPRSLQEAFGPYAGRAVFEPEEQPSAALVALRIVGILILAVCLLVAV